MNDDVEKDDSLNPWKIIEQFLLRLVERMNEIENRLSKIEMNHSKNIILNEDQVVEKTSLLGGRTISTSNSGTLERMIRIPACDICGKKLEKDFFICYSCGKKLCERCIVLFKNKNYCIECLKSLLPLTKKSFKVLVLVANEFLNIDKISELTKIKKEEVRGCLDELLWLGLITKRGASIFSSIQITDNGLEAIGAFRRVYGEDEDIAQLELNLNGGSNEGKGSL